MKMKCKELLVVILLGLPVISFGQIQQFSGRIIDNELKSPIKEAIVARNSQEIITNNLGAFKIEAIPGDTLKINHPGYEDLTFIVPGELTFTIALIKKIGKNNIVYSGHEVDQQPELVTGVDVFYKQWSANVLKSGYPKEARRNGVEGKVIIYFIIDEFGQVIESGIEKGIGYGCDEVTLKSFNNLKTKWTPGLKNGEKVKVRMSAPFIFKLG
jgi:TonB family protein